MNIWQRFKNWLIKKLGGYTEKEVDEVFNRAEEPWVELVKEYHNKYTAEHNAYIALLNCHNAAVEAAQKQDVTQMAKAIKAHCKAQSYCENCELADESGVCKLANSVPCCWEVE